jgi:hypothetical protein
MRPEGEREEQPEESTDAENQAPDARAPNGPNAPEDVDVDSAAGDDAEPPEAQTRAEAEARVDVDSTAGDDAEPPEAQTADEAEARVDDAPAEERARSVSQAHATHSRRARRRSRLVEKNRKLHAQKKRMRLALIAVSVASVSIIAGLLLQLADADESSRELQKVLLEARMETRKTQSALDESQTRVAALVEGRIPGLRPVEFDLVIEIAELGVRNMTFTRTHTADGSRMEVRAVMENDTNRALDPHVTLAVFDSLGIEMGRALIGLGDGERVNGMRDILPGEVRSFTAEVPIGRGDRPSYFLLLRP